MTTEEKIEESSSLNPEEIKRRFKTVFGRDMTPAEKKIFLLPVDLPNSKE